MQSHEPAGTGRLRDRIDLSDTDRPRVGFEQPNDLRHQRGLARAVMAEEAHHLARRDRQIDGIVGDHAGEAFRHTLNLECWACMGTHPRPPRLFLVGRCGTLRVDTQGIPIPTVFRNCEYVNCYARRMSAPLPPLTRSEQQLRTRTALIDAADAIFARDGYNAATLDDIAAAAG